MGVLEEAPELLVDSWDARPQGLGSRKGSFDPQPHEREAGYWTLVGNELAPETGGTSRGGNRPGRVGGLIPNLRGGNGTDR